MQSELRKSISRALVVGAVAMFGCMQVQATICTPGASWDFYCSGAIQGVECRYLEPQVDPYTVGSWFIRRQFELYQPGTNYYQTGYEQQFCQKPPARQQACDMADKNRIVKETIRSSLGGFYDHGDGGHAAASFYFEAMENEYDKQCNDPPRFDYDEVYEYTGSVPVPSFAEAWGTEHPFVIALDASFTRLIENLIGQTAAMERFQGAAIDLNAEGMLLQDASYDSFEADLPTSEAMAGSFLATIPDLFESLGMVRDLTIEGVPLFDFMRSMGTELGGEVIEYDFLSDPVILDPPQESDVDTDGVPDDVDNCPTTPNVDQSDFDGDSQGDACDPDDDNDGQSDADEHACGSDSLDNTSLSPDFDSDDQPDCVDPDDDNDLVLDSQDFCANTLIPESVPHSDLGFGKNRWALKNADGTFVQAPPQAGSRHSFSTSDTNGCSCEQIVGALEIGDPHLQRGCTTSVMIEWSSQ